MKADEEWTITVTDEMKWLAREVADHPRNHYRPTIDDGPEAQWKREYAGFLGELVFAAAYNLPPPANKVAQHDAVLGNFKVDIKTSINGSSSLPRNFWYPHRVDQMENRSDLLVYASWIEAEGVIVLLGWISKARLVKVGDFVLKGDKRPRESGGGDWVAKYDTVRLQRGKMSPMETLKVFSTCWQPKDLPRWDRALAEQADLFEGVSQPSVIVGGHRPPR